MALFFNHRKPRPFNYTPRYYDPEQEAREERKKEVLGERYKAPGEQQEEGGEYVPGSFLRQQVSARRNNTENEIFKRRKKKRKNMTVLAMVLFVLILLVWLLYFR